MSCPSSWTGSRSSVRTTSESSGRTARRKWCSRPTIKALATTIRTDPRSHESEIQDPRGTLREDGARGHRGLQQAGLQEPGTDLRHSYGDVVGNATQGEDREGQRQPSRADLREGEGPVQDETED